MDSSSIPDDAEVEQPSQTKETQDEFVTSQSKRKRKTAAETTNDNSGQQNEEKKPSKTRSEVWAHFTRFKNNRNKCKCNYCQKTLVCPSTSGTSSLRKHLGVCKQYEAWSESDSQKIIASKGEGSGLKTAKVSEEIFREAVNEMLVLSELPLNFVEGIGFQHFCNKVNLYKPHSRRTATRDIVEMFAMKKTVMKSWFAANKQRVSLTTDIWVADATKSSYMVITAHFIDSSWTLRKMILGFKYVDDHKGDTIKQVLLECLAEWGIDKIFTITVDNATANTSALGKFQREFQSNCEDALVLDGELMHMRCCAHILNLIVSDGMQEVSNSILAIRNAIQYVKSKPKRRKSFQLRVETVKIVKGSLPLDVTTRWNYTYLMLSKALEFKLAFGKMLAEDKLYIDYFNVVENGIKRVGPPMGTDWREIERLVDFLHIFYNSTLLVSTSNSVIAHLCYNEIASIEVSLKNLITSQDDTLVGRARVMKEKFDRYWEGTGVNKLLIVASVLDPRRKMHFVQVCFDEIYGKDSRPAREMYQSIMLLLTSLFKEYSQRFSRASNETSSQDLRTSQSQSGRRDSNMVDNDKGCVRMDSLFENVVDERNLADERNELEIYLKEKLHKGKSVAGTDFDLLSWWRCNQPKYPVLAEIARDVLAMQVSSVASESAFSTTGRIVEPSRSCLTHYMIEALVCTEQWLKCEIKRDERGYLTTNQMLADMELLDTLEEEFGTE